VDTETAVALVSGGTRGIGRGIATSLIAAGFHVVITGVHAPEDAQQALDELRSGVKTPRSGWSMCAPTWLILRRGSIC